MRPSYNCNFLKKVGQRCLNNLTKKLQKNQENFGFSRYIITFLLFGDNFKKNSPINFFIHVRIWHESHLLLLPKIKNKEKRKKD
jgi:hypothetical protein